MRYFTCLFFSINLLITFTIFSQEKFLLVGKVIDNKKNPIIGARIYFYSDSIYKTTSNFDGLFSINSSINNGKLYVTFSDLFSDTIQVSLLPNNNNNIIISLKEKIVLLESMDVSVGKFDKPIEEQTVSLEIIKPNIIENKNIRSIDQILDQSSGINILDGEPQIRGGSGFTFGVGSKVALLVDDMPMLSGDAGKPEWAFIPIENISQIEIIKGAASVLSGSAALSGSIHVRTAYPGLKPVTKVSTYIGLYDNPDVIGAKWWNNKPIQAGTQFLHSHKIKNLDVVIGANFNYDHGYLGPPKTDSIVATIFPDTVSNFTEKQMGQKKMRMNVQLRYHNQKIKGLTYGLNSNIMIHNSSMVMAWLNDSSGIFRAYPSAVFLQKQTIFHIDPFIQYYNNKWGTQSLKIRYFSSSNEMSANQSNEFVTYFADYSYKNSIEKLTNFDYIIGISYLHTKSFANIYSGSGSPYNDLNNTSFYAQFEKKLIKKIKISIGGRYEFFSLNDSIKDRQPIIRTGFNYQIFKPTFVRISYGQGYRFPTITERFIRTGVGNMGVFPNTSLKPEFSWNAEIGIKQLFKYNKFTGIFDIAAYLQEYKNTIEYVFGIWAPLTTPQALNKSAGFKFMNTGKSKVVGIDASLSSAYKLNKYNEIVYLLSYTYILPTSLTPDYVYAVDSLKREFSYKSTSLNPNKNILKYRFLHNVKADLEYSFHKFKIGISAKYFSKMENMDAVIKDFEKLTMDIEVLQNICYMNYYNKNRKGVLVFDTRVSYLLLEKYKLSFIINNLMNKTYSLRPLKIEAPRLFMLQVSFNL